MRRGAWDHLEFAIATSNGIPVRDLEIDFVTHQEVCVDAKKDRSCQPFCRHDIRCTDTINTAARIGRWLNRKDTKSETKQSLNFSSGAKTALDAAVEAEREFSAAQQAALDACSALVSVVKNNIEGGLRPGNIIGLTRALSETARSVQSLADQLTTDT